MTNFAKIIATLNYYKELSYNHKLHQEFLKDSKVILYAATLLEESDCTVLKLCLDIIENFVANEDTHDILLSTFGVYEALESLSVRKRNSDEDLSKRSTELTDILLSSVSPSSCSRLRSFLQPPRKNVMYLLLFDDLRPDNVVYLECVLLKIKGVISFIIDVELRRCTIRICPKITIDQIVKRIYNMCEMKALVVSKNRIEGIETLRDVFEVQLNKSNLEYFSDEDSTLKEKALTPILKILRNGNSIFKSLTSIFEESFYW